MRGETPPNVSAAQLGPLIESGHISALLGTERIPPLWVFEHYLGLFVPNPVFTLRLDGQETTEELLKRTYGDTPIRPDINGQNFPMWSQGRLDQVEIEVELVLSTSPSVSTSEVLDKFRGLGLERPTHELAFLFGVQHREIQDWLPIVFFHKPWEDKILRLWGDVPNLPAFNDRWVGQYAFPGVRRKTGNERAKG